MIYFGMRHDARKREMEHTERMRAIEMGIWPGRGVGSYLPQAAVAQVKACSKDEEQPSLLGMARKCYSIALWTPFWGFLFGGGFGRSWNAILIVGMTVATVSVVSVLCGTYLTARAQEFAANSPGGDGFFPKPPLDPDAYDVVSRRG
jgi:hypothetical protein